MRFSFKKDDDSPLGKQIAAVLDEMTNVGVNSDEYSTLMTLLERLTKIKAQVRRDPVSRDTLAVVVGHMLSTAFLVVYENKHVLRSTAAFQALQRGVKT